MVLIVKADVESKQKRMPVEPRLVVFLPEVVEVAFL